MSNTFQVVSEAGASLRTCVFTLKDDCRAYLYCCLGGGVVTVDMQDNCRRIKEEVNDR